MIEEVEVDLTEEEIEAEVAKLKKKFEAKQHAQTMKKAKVVGGKTGGKERPKPKQRQGSLMGFFKKK